MESREEEELDDHSAIIMAVDLRERGTVGCAYYVAHSETLYLLEEAKLGNAEVIDMRMDFVLCSSGYSDMLQVKSYISPTIIIANNRADDTVVDVLKPGVRSRTSDAESGIIFLPGLQSLSESCVDSYNLPYELRLRPVTEFSYESAKSKLANLHLDDASGSSASPQRLNTQASNDANDEDTEMTSGQEARLLRLWGFGDLNNRLTVRGEYVPFIRVLTTSLGRLCRSRHHLHTKDNGRQGAAGR